MDRLESDSWPVAMLLKSSTSLSRLINACFSVFGSGAHTFDAPLQRSRSERKPYLYISYDHSCGARSYCSGNSAQGENNAALGGRFRQSFT